MLDAVEAGAMNIKTVRILPHENFVSSRIDISVGMVPLGCVPNYRAAQFRYVGYLKFSSPVRATSNSSSAASVDFNITGSFLKLLVQQPHMNDRNVCQQVGISRLTIEGDVHLEESTRVLKTSGPDFHLLLQGIDLEDDFIAAEAESAGLDTDTQRVLRKVQRLKDDSEDREDYEEAQRLSEIIGDVEVLGRNLIAIENEKQSCVASENYAAAGQLKEKAATVRKQLADAVKAATTRPARRPRDLPSAS